MENKTNKMPPALEAINLPANQKEELLLAYESIFLKKELQIPEDILGRANETIALIKSMEIPATEKTEIDEIINAIKIGIKGIEQSGNKEFTKRDAEYYQNKYLVKADLEAFAEDLARKTGKPQTVLDLNSSNIKSLEIICTNGKPVKGETYLKNVAIAFGWAKKTKEVSLLDTLNKLKQIAEIESKNKIYSLDYSLFFTDHAQQNTQILVDAMLSTINQNLPPKEYLIFDENFSTSNKTTSNKTTFAFKLDGKPYKTNFSAFIQGIFRQLTKELENKYGKDNKIEVSLILARKYLFLLYQGESVAKALEKMLEESEAKIPSPNLNLFFTDQAEQNTQILIDAMLSTINQNLPPKEHLIFDESFSTGNKTTFTFKLDNKPDENYQTNFNSFIRMISKRLTKELENKYGKNNKVKVLFPLAKKYLFLLYQGENVAKALAIIFPEAKKEGENKINSPNYDLFFTDQAQQNTQILIDAMLSTINQNLLPKNHLIFDESFSTGNNTPFTFKLGDKPDETYQTNFSAFINSLSNRLTKELENKYGKNNKIKVNFILARKYLFLLYQGESVEKALEKISLSSEDLIDQELEQISTLKLEDAVSLLQDDSVKLRMYLQFAYPELLPEEIDKLVIRAIKAIYARDNFTKENNLLLTHTLNLDSPIITTDIPVKTDKNTITISGTATNTDFVYFFGAYSKRARVNTDGTFTIKIPLRQATSNEIRWMAVNTEKQTRSDQNIVAIEQTSTKDDTQALMQLLSLLGTEKLAEYANDENKLELLKQCAEQMLIKKFTVDFNEGVKYINKLKKECDSPVIKNVLDQVIAKFVDIESKSINYLKGDNDLYFFQKYCYESIKNKIETGDKGVILANAPGLGKTLVALAVARNEEESLIISPNNVVSGWTKEANEFFDDFNLLRLQNLSTADRKEILRHSNHHHIVTNIEFLRKVLNDEEIAELLAGDGKKLLVYDEAHNLINKNQQTEGTLKLDKKFFLLLSASPFKNPLAVRRMLNSIYPDKIEYSSDSAFKKAFPQDDPEALRALNRLIQNHVIRFRKQDVMEEFDLNKPLAEQKGRLPHKENISPYEMGKFTMHDAQAEAVYEMFLDWNKWCNKYDKFIPQDQVAKLDGLRTGKKENGGNNLTKEQIMESAENVYEMFVNWDKKYDKFIPQDQMLKLGELITDEKENGYNNLTEEQMMESAENVYEMFVNWDKKYDKFIPQDQILKLGELITDEKENGYTDEEMMEFNKNDEEDEDFNLANQILGNASNLSKKHAIRQIINNPEYIGLEGVENRKHAVIKELVNKNLAEGRKVVLFCKYNTQAQQYAQIFPELNPAVYTGITSKEKEKKRANGQKIFYKVDDNKNYLIDKTTGLPIEDTEATKPSNHSLPMQALEYEEIKFQNHADCKLMISTYSAGSVGKTFTAGKAMIEDDLPDNYIEQYQTEDRIHRIDNNYLTHYEVKYYQAMSTFSPEFLAKMKNIWLRKITNQYQLIEGNKGEKAQLIPYDENDEDTEIMGKIISFNKYEEVFDPFEAKKEELPSAYETFFADGTYDQVHLENLATQQVMFGLINDGIANESILEEGLIPFAGLE